MARSMLGWSPADAPGSKRNLICKIRTANGPEPSPPPGPSLTLDTLRLRTKATRERCEVEGFSQGRNGKKKGSGRNWLTKNRAGRGCMRRTGWADGWTVSFSRRCCRRSPTENRRLQRAAGVEGDQTFHEAIYAAPAAATLQFVLLARGPPAGAVARRIKTGPCRLRRWRSG
ncbi:hypothetical protein HPP92_018191 [Vanilla planifolia]|uniref:Uncharacterized protein n=1 Tax=Vanilla planifolia TaxID=51239 RepID=A0A835UP98_VANPL|nr:hypothetical protein HPP92_018191 [Vanilla planifolia]